MRCCEYLLVMVVLRTVPCLQSQRSDVVRVLHTVICDMYIVREAGGSKQQGAIDCSCFLLPLPAAVGVFSFGGHTVGRGRKKSASADS